MVEFKVLVVGYAHPGKGDNYEASPTSLLLISNGKKIIVDPGANSKLLLTSLEQNSLKPDDVTDVFLTHYHPDHFLNLKFFPQADVIDGSMIWKDDEEIVYKDIIPGTEIKVLSTPGHTPENHSLVFDTTEYGTVVHAADVFWWEDGQQITDDYQKLLDHVDPFATEPEKLHESRKAILNIADYIIPGHGTMFKNNFKK